jgi:serine/threonine protein phosphatase 1
MYYVTSDPHGKFECLLALLNKARFFDREDNHLTIIGDIIDRNEHGGIDILKWILEQPNVTLLLGNHEKMMLDCRRFLDRSEKTPINSQSIRMLDQWKRNGGNATIDALKKESPETIWKLLEYLSSCPLYQTLQIGDHSYVLVHGGLENFSPDRELASYEDHELLWERPDLTTLYSPEQFTVILGHTPTDYYGDEYQGRMLKTKGWWDLDTGAARIKGTPMLLCLDTLDEYYIDSSDGVDNSDGDESP